MTSSNFKMEVLSGPERRRRWSTAEKLAIIHETYKADATVSIVPVGSRCGAAARSSYRARTRPGTIDCSCLPEFDKAD